MKSGKKLRKQMNEKSDIVYKIHFVEKRKKRETRE